MLKSLLLLPTLTASTGTTVVATSQQANISARDEIHNHYREKKYEISLSAKAKINLWGSPGSNEDTSKEAVILKWSKVAKNRSDFFEKYEKVSFVVYSKLGGQFEENKVDGAVTINTKEAFAGPNHIKYVSGYSTPENTGNIYVGSGSTYIETRSDEDYGYIKIGAYVEGGWYIDPDAEAVAQIELYSATFYSYYN